MFNNSNFLLREHNKYSQNNIPFQNNKLLSNNPNYINTLNNNMFQQKLNMVKMEQINKLKQIAPNIDKDKLIEYVICPIKINKCDKNELNKNLSIIEKSYISDKTKNNELNSLWKNRTNLPYKTIIRNNDYKKKIKSNKDLIVHKVTTEDKIGLMKQYDELQSILKQHNTQLSVIYSKSEELDHKKKFKYNNSYKFRLKHDPKNFNDIKELHKKEQTQIDKQQQKIDNLINTLMDSDILNQNEKNKMIQDIEEQQKNINEYNKQIKCNLHTKVDENIDENIDEKIDEEIDKIKKELGEEYNELNNSTKNIKTNNRDKIKIKCATNNNDDILIGHIDNDILNKYKNRNKK